MVLVSYDVKQNHVAMKSSLKTKGFKDIIFGVYEISGERSSSVLPNTTLWIEGNDTRACREIVKTTALETNAILEKVISVEFTNWSAMSL